MIHFINYTGNIGSGKTTRLNDIIESYDLHDYAEKIKKESNQLFILDDRILGFVFEPVDNNPFLADFYRDKKAYGFLMETFIIEYLHIKLNEFIDQYKLLNAQKDLYIYTDYGVPIVFINHLKSKNLLTDAQYECLLTINEIFYNDFIFYKFDKIKIKYIDIKPEECLDNIIKRNRGCEVAVSLELLSELDSIYKKQNEIIESKILHLDRENFNKIKLSKIKYIKENQLNAFHKVFA